MQILLMAESGHRLTVKPPLRGAGRIGVSSLPGHFRPLGGIEGGEYRRHLRAVSGEKTGLEKLGVLPDTATCSGTTFYRRPASLGPLIVLNPARADAPAKITSGAQASVARMCRRVDCGNVVMPSSMVIGPRVIN